jgi:deoxyribonuclease-4
MGQGIRGGISQLSTAIRTAREKARKAESHQPVIVLLENGAGQKNSVGSAFGDLRVILDTLGDSEQYGICLDTCHLFASGHDLRTKHSVDETLTDFDKSVGLGELRFIHLNDSKGGLNSNLDRHDHIGLGSIGKAGLAAFLNHNAIRKLPKIMETPIDERRGDEENLRVVLGMVR